MAKSTGEELINHYGAIRLRVRGAASLKPTLFSLDEVSLNALSSIAIQAKNNIEPNRLSNFTQQRAKLELRTTEIDETFEISKIIVFAKPVAKSWPEGTTVSATGSVVSPSIVGPVGPQGVPGAIGNTGATGSIGATGATGPAGTQTIPSFAQTIESTAYTITGAYADVTDLTVTITPKLATSKVRVLAVINNYLGTNLTVINYQILRDGSVIKEFKTVGFNADTTASEGKTTVLDYLDSPASTSAIVYKIQAKCPNGVAGFVNLPINGGDILYSSITVSEILQ